jgi:hypothetical protein
LDAAEDWAQCECPTDAVPSCSPTALRPKEGFAVTRSVKGYREANDNLPTLERGEPCPGNSAAPPWLMRPTLSCLPLPDLGMFRMMDYEDLIRCLFEIQLSDD